MKTRKTATFFLCVFVTFVLVFTFYGDDLYRMTIPKVVAEKVAQKKLPLTMETPEGVVTTERRAMVVSLDAVTDEVVYVLYETESGYYVTQETIETGRSGEDWVEVLSGLGSKSLVVTGSDRMLCDGGEVILLSEETEQIRLHRSGSEAEKEQFVAQCTKKNGKTALVTGLLFVGGGIVAWFVCRKRLKMLLAPLLVVLCLVSVGYFVKHVEVFGEGITMELNSEALKD